MTLHHKYIREIGFPPSRTHSYAYNHNIPLAGTEEKTRLTTFDWEHLVLAVTALAGAARARVNNGRSAILYTVDKETVTYVDWHWQDSVPEQHASLTGMEMICSVGQTCWLAIVSSTTRVGRQGIAHGLHDAIQRLIEQVVSM